MRSTTLFAAIALLVAATAQGRARSDDCPTDVAAAVADACACAGKRVGTGELRPWSSHGGYQRCVLRAVGAQRRAGCVSNRDATQVLRCAERSTCGRGNAVLCALDDGARLRVARHAAACVGDGGEVLGVGSVCETPVPPTSTTGSTSTSTSTTTTTTLAVDLYGNPVEFAGASQHAPGYLLGGPVTVTRAGTLTQVGVIGKATGARVVLALYADDHGAPGRLLVSGPATPVEPGPHEVAVSPTPLAAGAYWLMAVFDADASVGLDEPVDDAIVAYTECAAGDPLPDPFPPAQLYGGQRFNYYLRVVR